MASVTYFTVPLLGLCKLLLFVNVFHLTLVGWTQAVEEVNGPCLGCHLFNFIHEHHPENKKDTAFCHYPCQCPVEELDCAAQNRTRIRDGCGCCYTCARQLSESCTVKHLCDPESNKELYCDRRDDKSTGICKSKHKKNPCHYKGAIFQHGETFSPECSQVCTCQNGFYGCSTRCPQELIKPSELTCHDPKLIKIKSACCREWTCQKVDAAGSVLVDGLESQSLVRRRPRWNPETTTAPPTLRPYFAGRGVVSSLCQQQSDSDWTPCSVTCGTGVSVRTIVDRVTCSTAQELRLCLLRPCEETFNRTRCTPTYKTPYRRRIIYQDCISVRDYKLKFCDTCKTDKCCFPRRTRQKQVKFQCSRGVRQTYNFLWIKQCRCADKCYEKRKRRGRGRKRRERARQRRRLERANRRRNRKNRKKED